MCINKEKLYDYPFYSKQILKWHKDRPEFLYKTGIFRPTHPRQALSKRDSALLKSLFNLLIKEHTGLTPRSELNPVPNAKQTKWHEAYL